MAISVVKNRQPGAFISPKRDKFMVELTCLVISEAKRDVEEDLQLNNSCFIMSVGHKKVIKLANPLDQVVKSMDDMSVGHKMVYKLTNPTDQVVKSMDYMLVGHEMVTELTNPTDQVMKGMKEDKLLDTKASSLRNKKLCTTAFNICKTVSIQQQCQTGTYANKQCRGLDKQVGITMTHLAYYWDKNKQMQNVFYVVRDQGVFNKAT